MKQLLFKIDHPFYYLSIVEYLYNIVDIKKLLNISILIKHINELDDDNYRKFFYGVFNIHSGFSGYKENNISISLRSLIKQIESDSDKINNNRFIFWLQACPLADYHIYHEFVFVCKNIIRKKIKLECFKYLKSSKSEYLSKLQSDLFS